MHNVISFAERNNKNKQIELFASQVFNRLVTLPGIYSKHKINSSRFTITYNDLTLMDISLWNKDVNKTTVRGRSWWYLAEDGTLTEDILKVSGFIVAPFVNGRGPGFSTAIPLVDSVFKGLKAIVANTGFCNKTNDGDHVLGERKRVFFEYDNTFIVVTFIPVTIEPWLEALALHSVKVNGGSITNTTHYEDFFHTTHTLPQIEKVINRGFIKPIDVQCKQQKADTLLLMFLADKRKHTMVCYYEFSSFGVDKTNETPVPLYLSPNDPDNTLLLYMCVKACRDRLLGYSDLPIGFLMAPIVYLNEGLIKTVAFECVLSNTGRIVSISPIYTRQQT